MTNTDKLITDFITAASKDLTYNDAAKKLFHTRGLKLLKQIAVDLGYAPDTYDVRSNKGGIAVGGEVTLHADDLYVQFCGGSIMPAGIMYRSCKGRKDYCGGSNNWLQFDAMINYNGFLQKLLSVAGRN